ncbi:hypothetical protein [Konateibacter massiliensis]|uniref:hypothetical protein n=1 Tax=Konateibacter massiliensis TaxID=2002841 RepID=UPI000C162414|nr:hypothetical protein [Konateibacter massiliensis]
MVGLIIIGAIAWIAWQVLKDVSTTPYDPGSYGGSHEAQTKFRQDISKVSFGEMSQRELDRNTRNGKYRDK